MTVQLTDKQLLAMKKHAATSLRKWGIKGAEGFEEHRLNWSKLNAHAKEAIKTASELIDKVTDDTEEREAASIEDAYETLMQVHDACENEKDIRSRIGDRSPRERGGDPRTPVGDDISVRGDALDGSSAEDSEQATVGLHREQRMVDWARDRGAEEHRGLTTGDYLRAMVLGAKNDAEHRALSEGTDSAGGYTVPTILSSRLIDLLRAASVAIRAGAITVPLTSDVNHIAKVATDPVPAWRAEAAVVAESDPTFTNVTFEPKSMAVLVKVSRELLDDSLNIATALPEIITSAMAVELDRVALFGSGTAPEPEGLVNITGVGEIAHAAALANYARLVQARTTCLTANTREVTAYILHPRDDGTLAELVDTTGQPLQVPPKIADVPMLTTTAVPIDGGVGSDESTIITGDFRRLMIGMRSEIQIEVLRERYSENLQYGFLAWMRADVAVEHASAFTKITGIQP